MRRRCRAEDGDAVTETVIVVPVLLLLIMVVVQFGLWYHAEHVVQAAAQEGVRAARALDGTPESGKERAQRFLEVTAASLIEEPAIHATRDDRHAAVEVTGRAVAVIPGLRLGVRSRAVSPTEGFRADR
ncbi:MAG: TadE/TadG family type IV pilus assembly protein [Acidimicrobiales bacterium]